MKKLFSAVLAVAMLGTTIIPVSFADILAKGKGNSPGRGGEQTEAVLQSEHKETPPMKSERSEKEENSKRNQEVRRQLGEAVSTVNHVYRDERKELIKGANEDRKDLKDSYKEGFKDAVNKSVYREAYKDGLKDSFEKLKEELKNNLKENRQKWKETQKKTIREIMKKHKEKKDNSTHVFADGKDVEFDVKPIIKEGRTLIPVRAVTASLGAEVNWDPATKTVSVNKTVYGTGRGEDYVAFPEPKKVEIKLTIGSTTITVNGQPITIEVPAQLHSNRTVVPLRAIATALFKEIEFDPESGAVILND